MGVCRDVGLYVEVYKGVCRYMCGCIGVHTPVCVCVLGVCRLFVMPLMERCSD